MSLGVLEDQAARSLRNGLTQWVQLMKMTGQKPPPGFAYSSFHEYVLTHGRIMTSRKPTASQLRQVAIDVASIQPEVQQCFFNSQKLALQFPERYRYFEGFAFARFPLPLQHGWTVTRGRNPIIVDSTWRRDQDGPFKVGNIVVGEIPKDWAYMGVEFSRQWLLDRWKSGMAGSILDWPPKFPAMCNARRTRKKS